MDDICHLMLIGLQVGQNREGSDSRVNQEWKNHENNIKDLKKKIQYEKHRL